MTKLCITGSTVFLMPICVRIEIADTAKQTATILCARNPCAFVNFSLIQVLCDLIVAVCFVILAPPL